MSPRAYLTVRPVPVGPIVPQRDGVAWMKAALERARPASASDEAKRAQRLYDLIARQSTVASRATCLPDYTHTDWEAMDLFGPSHSGDGQAPAASRAWSRPLLEERMEVFAQTALDAAHTAFDTDTEAPDALLQVSCTGYDSPTAVQHIALEKGWGAQSRILHIGHMGCYAALPAAATAADLVAATAARHATVGADAPADAHAVVFLVELCTLHHKVAATEPEVIVQQCLFADGAARLDLRAAAPTDPAERARSFALLDHSETLVPDTLGEMTWRVADSAFAMTLSRRVPDRLREGLAGAVGSLLRTHDLTPEALDIVAVHPGGPRVIEATAESLGLRDEQVRHSHAVLHDRGNMSSTTLPHIWDRIAHDDDVPQGATVLSLAFGPGLTVAANLMRKGA